MVAGELRSGLVVAWRLLTFGTASSEATQYVCTIGKVRGACNNQNVSEPSRVGSPRPESFIEPASPSGARGTILS
jgi:hypothetical protein